MRARRCRLLLIGPAPYREGGARVSFEIMHEYLGRFPCLGIEHFDLPIHHPLYDENGRPGPLSHLRTVTGVLRAITRIPRVDTIVLFGSGDVCFSYGLAFLLCARLFRKRCVARLTGGRAIFDSKLLPAPVQAICLAMFRIVDALVVQTEIARSDVPAKLRSKTIVVRGFRPRPSGSPTMRRDDGEARFVFVGRSEEVSNAPSKGLDVLLDAFDRICSGPIRRSGSGGPTGRIELHVCGPIPRSLTTRVKRTPDVFAHGKLSNDRLCAELRQNDVLVFPSRYKFEGHPGAIIEAFMAGLPVIASDLPGPSEIVRHEVNGLIISTGDADALAAAMIRLATDGALRRRLAAGARASASHFDQDRVLPELVKALGLLPAGAEAV